MKPLLLWSLFFISTHALFAGEMFDQKIQQKFISTIKDHEVTSILQKTKEFDECRQLNKFNPKEPSKGDLNGAIKCFQDKLKSKDGDALVEISNNLGLESFGLVQSKNTAEIQSYLSDKMYQALTGIDLREKNKEKLMESMKFKNHKQIDQKKFIDLYTAQLTKNALYEISRFCFENLRLVANPNPSENTDFVSYWKKNIDTAKVTINPATKKPPFFDSKDLTDTGDKGFGTFSGDEKKIYEEIFKSVGLSDNSNGNFNLSDMGLFFESICMVNIKELCSEYTKNKLKGGKACLTQAKLTKMRKAIVDAETIKKEEFEKMTSNGSFQIQFDDGQAAEFENNKSIDELTAQSSDSILSNSISSDVDKAAERCKTNPNAQECENFIQIGDDKNANLHKQEMEMSFKSEAEKAKIEKLIKESSDPQTLEKYLEQKGYFDIIAKMKDNPNLDVAEEVWKKLETEKQVALDAIRKKLGKRQITENEAGGSGKSDAIQTNAKEASEERARLAQVVLFNNIITSQLELKDKNDPNKSLGRNISGIKKEINELKNNPNVNTAYFEGLQKTVDDPSNSSADNNGALSGTSLIDSILGKKGDPAKPAKSN